MHGAVAPWFEMCDGLQVGLLNDIDVGLYPWFGLKLREKAMFTQCASA